MQNYFVPLSRQEKPDSRKKEMTDSTCLYSIRWPRWSSALAALLGSGLFGVLCWQVKSNLHIPYGAIKGFRKGTLEWVSDNTKSGKSLHRAPALCIDVDDGIDLYVYGSSEGVAKGVDSAFLVNARYMQESIEMAIQRLEGYRAKYG